MSITYENKRVFFEAIRRKYDDYVALYRAINGGSSDGIAPFSEFYWHLTYYSKYSSPQTIPTRR